MTSNTAAVLKTLQDIAAKPPDSEADRKQIAKAAYELARAVEPLDDQAQRLIYSQTIVPLMVTANDIHLFEILSKPVGQTFSTRELAEKTGSDETLLSEIVHTSFVSE